MGIFLFKTAAVLALVQSPQTAHSPPAAHSPHSPQNPHPDSVRAALWAKVAADSTDGSAWLELGRAYLERSADYHAHKKPVTVDTVLAHAVLDTAQLAFEQSERFSTGTRRADSARVYRLYVYGERAALDWEAAGISAATLAWHAVPEDMRLPPVLEELGENLLRACPHQGILFTEGETDTQAAWYLRFSRGLRPDLTIVPFERWRGDSVLRNRVLRELKTRDPALRALSQSRAVCASMAFERPPDERTVKWNKRPLVWVTGKETSTDRVPPQDFVFAALKQAVDDHDTWTAPVTAIYRRATANSGGLCSAFETFGLGSEVGCR